MLMISLAMVSRASNLLVWLDFAYICDLGCCVAGYLTGLVVISV